MYKIFGKFLCNLTDQKHLTKIPGLWYNAKLDAHPAGRASLKAKETA
jgi:hypothetical protein